MKPPIFFPPYLRAMRRGNSRLGLTLGLTTLLTLGLSTPAVHAQTYTEQVIHSFTGNPSDGSFPEGTLTNVNGILYGTTVQGSSHDEGTVFSIDPTTHIETILYTFQDIADGFFPISSLLDLGGTLYGTTNDGGSGPGGTLFSVNPNGSNKQILYSFAGGGTSDGEFPEGSLLAVSGILYGTTEFGGVSSGGTVFSVNPSTHAEQVLSSFGKTSTEGNTVNGILTDVNGLLYGTTQNGGAHNKGIVFSIDPNTHAETTVYSFGGSAPDGATPYAGLTLVNGTLYGTTTFGGSHNAGMIFSLNPSTHAVSILYSFGTQGRTDGTNPQASLTLFNGMLYGTTAEGGIDDQGTLFSIDPSTHAVSILYSFGTNGGSTDGNLPQTALIALNGILYGTTSDGGTNGEGTVYSLTIAGTPPVAKNDAYTTPYNTVDAVAAPGVLTNDDNGGKPMTAVLDTKPAHGTLAFKSDGSFTYTPTTGFAGTDTFTYQAVNAIGKSNSATVTLTVHPAVPTAVNHYVTTQRNTILNDPAPGVLGGVDNGGSSPVTAVLVAKPTHGSLTLNSNGAFTYTPTKGFTGVDSFTYQAVNAVGKSNIATTYLTVQ